MLNNHRVRFYTKQGLPQLTPQMEASLVARISLFNLGPAWLEYKGNLLIRTGGQPFISIQVSKTFGQLNESVL